MARPTHIQNKPYEAKLYQIFIFSLALCTAAGTFGVYAYKIYDRAAFIFYYVIELLFFLGLVSGSVFYLSKPRVRNIKTISLSSFGVVVCCLLNATAIICFLYFLWLYLRTSAPVSFGHASMSSFYAEGRTFAEKLTLAAMHMGAESTYLIVHTNKHPSKLLRLFSSMCLFLPGVRGAIMGKRFALVIDVILFIYINRQGTSFPLFARRIPKNMLLKRVIISLLAGSVFAICVVLFKERAQFTALERFEFEPGDMVVRPFWIWLREITEGRLDPLYELNDYVAEAPYVFSYFLSRRPPDKLFWGAFSFPPLTQILSAVFPVVPPYEENLTHIASGKYSGIGYMLIADFGLYLAPIVSFLYGVLFSFIERSRKLNYQCNTVYPILVVVCLFAPVYHLNVGRVDYMFLFSFVFTPFLLTEISSKRGDTSSVIISPHNNTKSRYVIRK